PPDFPTFPTRRSSDLALGAAQQVPVPVDHAGDDDAVRFVDERGRPVLRLDRRPLADLRDDPAGHRDRAVPVDLAVGVERDDPLTGDDGVDDDRSGSVRGCHRPLPRVCAGVPTAAAGVAARWRQTRYPPQMMAATPKLT